jgi:hypothetical protein
MDMSKATKPYLFLSSLSFSSHLGEKKKKEKKVQRNTFELRRQD